MLHGRSVALIAVFLTLTALAGPRAAGAGGLDQFVGLGDSTIDTGWFRYNSTGVPGPVSPTPYTLDQLIQNAVANGAQGGWAGNGVMGATILTDKFGLSAAPNGAPGGGTNYANGAGYTNVPGPMPGSVSAVQQIQNYLASVNNAANPHALYEISSGNNDLLKYQQFPADFLSTSASALASAVADLQAAGARTILVPNSFLYAVYAGSGGDIVDPTNQADYVRAMQYNDLRWADLTAAGVRFIPADLDAVFKYVVHHPTRFGFTANSVLSDQAPVYNVASPYNSALLADDTLISQAQQQAYLFIDGHHLTTAGQTIEADYEYSLLIAPSQILLLAESALQSTWSRVATIQGQIELSAQHRGPGGTNAWASAGAASTRYTNAPGFAGDSGAPGGGSVGVDILTQRGLILGAAFTAGTQRQEFSTGGFFDQVDEAPSLYAATTGGPLWGNAVLSFDAIQDRTFRPVPLGLFTDENHANTTAQSLSLALRGGGDLAIGRLITGPVVGLVLQEARVHRFTETDGTGVTALSFGNQNWDSAVTQLGWRAAMDVGALQPFAEMSWNHECAGLDRTVTASLTSISASPYTMDAVPMVRDWATLSLGANYLLSPRVILRGTASSIFCNPQMIAAGGELGLNFAF